MKWVITTIISIITLVTTVVLFNIGNEKPDLVYTVSGNIPMNTSDDSRDSNIQQVEVKNIGNQAANNIQIVIDGEIIDSKVIKDSEADKVTIYPDKFELVYTELPPEGNFKLIIESTLNGLNENILTVKSENGLARNGLEDKENPLLLLIITAISFLVYFTIMAYSIRDMLINQKVKRIALRAYESMDYIYKKKPFYIKENDWKDIVKTFIQVKLKEDISTKYTISAEKLNCIFILKSDRPLCLSEGDWTEIKREAKETLFLKIDYAAFIQSYSNDRLTEFLTSIYDYKISFSETLNLELSKELSSSYLKNRKNKFFIYTKDINNELTKPKPKFVIAEDWEEYQSFLGNLQYMYILEEIYKSYNNPFEKIAEYEKIIHKDIKELKKLAYDIEFYRFISNTFNHLFEKIELKDKPNWMEDEDYQKINRIKTNINSNVDKEKTIDEQIYVISEVVNKNKLPDEKPYSMSDKHWDTLNLLYKYSDEIKNLEEETEKRSTELNQKERELGIQKEEVGCLKDTIERQLHIVNEIFNDPTVIDRIESYNNVFAMGNYESLVKLAEKLKKDIQ